MHSAAENSFNVCNLSQALDITGLDDRQTSSRAFLIDMVGARLQEVHLLKALRDDTEKVRMTVVLLAGNSAAKYGLKTADRT